MASIKKALIGIFHKKPSMYTGSIVLNVLGAQPFRTFFLWFRRVARPPKRIPAEYRKAFKELKRNGAVVIPNFLSPEDYKKFKEEFDRLSPSFPPDYSEISLPHVDRLSIYDSRVSDFTKNLFLKNHFINSMMLSYLNRRYSFPYNAYLTKIYLNQEELDKPKNGGTNNLHFDAPCRVLKFFYYVTDTNEENSALNYCVGTQKRNSLSRLWFEYKLSIRYALNKWNPNNSGEYLAKDPWVKLTPQEIKKYKLQETVLAAEGNTLIAADVGAFHRRGEFLKPGMRQTVEINFRDIETTRNSFYPIEQKILSLFGRGKKQKGQVLAPQRSM
jgi:hypothetical protein